MQLAGVGAFGRWATLLLSSVLAKLQGMVRVFMVWVVSAGPMPTHIAFIMDGNRRFADRLHVDRRIGHSHGYDTLLGTLKDCFDLHVKIVTLFAFSIDNFQRSPDEVSALMDLMQSKLEILVEKQGLASEHGIRVQVLGDLHLLPQGARIAAEKAMAVTKHNSSLILNLCISYTSTQEIVRSIQQTRDNFLAAWSTYHEQFGHDIVDSCANSACKNGVSNGSNFFKDGFDIMQGGKGGCDELKVYEYDHASNGFNNGNGDDCFSNVNRKELVNGNGFSKIEDAMSFGEGMVAESRTMGRDARASFAPAIAVTRSIGLRDRNKTKTGALDDFGLQNLSFDAVCSSDMYLRTDTYANEVRSNVKRAKLASVRNEFMLSEDVVYELDHANEAINPCTSDAGMSLQCPRNWNALTNCRCHLRPFHSCEKQAEIDSSFTYDSGKPCYMNDDDRTIKAAKEYVSEQEIEKNLYTYPCPPPDLLIRTSGETRLSNFLLWQTSFSHLAFCKVLWPEFSFRHLFFIILEYQRAFPSLLKKRQYYDSESWRHH